MAQAAGLASPKGLRHGFVDACLTQKIPVPTVQKLLGHARMETTAIYLEVTDDEERELATRLWTKDLKIFSNQLDKRSGRRNFLGVNQNA
ncbi:MAG: tyrosine-type recombinase/integrase [Verrucomicrobiota bacterium]